jgi:hypothetical protein
MNKEKRKLTFMIFAILISAFFVFEKKTVYGEDCSQLDGNDKKQCLLLEEKAEAYRKLIELKNKQQTTLNSQLVQIDKEQSITKTDLQMTQAQLEETDKKIGDIAQDIEDKEREFQYQKKILSGLLQAYYDYDQQGILELVMMDQNLSEIFSQTAGIEQSGTKISEVLTNVRNIRDELKNDHEEIVNKKAESEKLKSDLEERHYYLQASETQKQSLLDQTQGEEAKYQDLLARVEEQKMELFDFSAAGNLDEVSATVDDYEKPTSNLASTSWYFSQKDSRWGNKTIGNSSSLMKDWGCAVTSVAMVFKKLGASIDPGKLAKQKIYYYDLINWPDSWSGGINLASSTGHGNISWSSVDSQIKKGKPVIVYIKRYKGGGHYVVIHGKDKKDYIVHDPYFGPNLYLSTSKALVGKLGADSKTTVDQMIIYN